jgi:predicted esterase
LCTLALGPSATRAPFESLAVPGFAASLVSLPTADRRAPIVIVTHGAGGTAEAHCALWARITRGKALLLCVRGRARSPDPEAGEYYPDHLELERETFAALGALRAHYAPKIAEGPVLYAGFSQGATMGALMLVPHGSEVTRLVLVEGGYAEWSVARAREFRENGGESVLFVCGRKECADAAQKSAYWFKLAGVSARLEYVAGAGHSHDGRVEARVVSAWPWLTSGDPRWED